MALGITLTLEKDSDGSELVIFDGLAIPFQQFPSFVLGDPNEIELLTAVLKLKVSGQVVEKTAAPVIERPTRREVISSTERSQTWREVAEEIHGKPDENYVAPDPFERPKLMFTSNLSVLMYNSKKFDEEVRSGRFRTYTPHVPTDLTKEDDEILAGWSKETGTCQKCWTLRARNGACDC